MPTDNLYTEFFNKVKHMRSLQKQYFATRSPAILVSSKTAETEIDQLILTVGKRLEARNKIKN